MDVVLERVAQLGTARRGVAVRAAVNYTRRTGVRPRNYTYEPPPGIPRHSGEVDAREVTIRNGRLLRDLGLDRSGFELIREPSMLRSWSDFQDADRVKAFYYPEVQSTLRTYTAAQSVLVFDHTLRDSSASSGSAALREPVRRVHDDQTFASAPARVRKHLPPAVADWRLGRRFAIVNFWRPIGVPVQQAPLALCDARSIDLQDLIPSDLVYPDWTGETYAFAFNPAHRWVYFPQQTPDEVTLVKVYDSLTDGTARLTAHTAFDDPATPYDAPPRRSIEVRAMLFW